MPTAFVTGASGFVGANLARALLDRGWRVRALVRGDAPSLAGLDVEIVRGDLFAPELTAAMRGCDALFHVAATYSLWRRDRAAVMRANVDGTRSVLAAARAAGVPRTVHTSSVAAIGVRDDAAARRRDAPEPAGASDRRLQALEVPRRAGGAARGRGRPGRRDREPDHACRAVGREAHAHRRDRRPVSHRAHAGVRRHGAQPRRRARRRRWATCSPTSAACAANATSWATRT